MRPAAQLEGIARHLDDTNDVAVLLPEQHRRAEAPRLVDRRLEDVHGPVLEHELVHAALDILSLLGSERAVVGEVEAELVGSHRGARLPYVLAEHISQRLLEEVRAGVVRHGREAHGPWHARADAISRGEARPAEEKRLVALEAIGIHELGNGAGPVVELDRAGIGHLTTAGGIERRLAQLGEEVVVVHDLERPDLRDDVGLRVADELGREVRRTREVGGALKLARAAGARDVAMPVHLDAIAVDVDGLAPLLGELDRELERKPVRRREREGLLARDRLVGADLLEELEPALERLEKALLLEPKDASDLVGILGELGVGIGHLLDDHAREAMHVV